MKYISIKKRHLEIQDLIASYSLDYLCKKADEILDAGYTLKVADWFYKRTWYSIGADLEACATIFLKNTKRMETEEDALKHLKRLIRQMINENQKTFLDLVDRILDWEEE